MSAIVWTSYVPVVNLERFIPCFLIMYVCSSLCNRDAFKNILQYVPVEVHIKKCSRLLWANFLYKYKVICLSFPYVQIMKLNYHTLFVSLIISFISVHHTFQMVNLYLLFQINLMFDLSSTTRYRRVWNHCTKKVAELVVMARKHNA